MDQPPSTEENKNTDSHVEQRRHCLEHAGDLIASAELLLAADQAYPNIAYHLGILAVEEIGKAGMLDARAATRGAFDGKWIEKRLDDHVFKFMWAVWSPTMSGGKIDPKAFEEARQFAERTHARRMAGLYVDHAENSVAVPPRDVVRLDHATSLLNLAKARLALETQGKRDDQFEGNDDLEWFLATASDDFAKKRLFSQLFIAKREDLRGNTRAWVRWARDEFARIKEEEQKYLQQELSREASEFGDRKPKWLMKVRVQTPSHSLRQKVLNTWNDRIDSVKLRATGDKPPALLLEMKIHDGVTIDRLFDVGLAWSKRYIVMLNIGTAGFFWYELSGQAEVYYESIKDLESDLVPHVVSARGLSREWSEEALGVGKRQRVALEEAHINNAIKCLAVFGSMDDENAEPIFGPYLHGLTLLSKTDLHLSVAKEARDAFLKVLRSAMIHFGDLKAEDTDLLPNLHRAMESVIPEEPYRNQLFESLGKDLDRNEMLSGAVSAKRVADLYLVIVANRLWPEYVERARRRNEAVRRQEG